MQTRAAWLAAAIAVVVTGVVAAATVPLDRPGIGWVITGLTAVVSLSVAMARRNSPDEPDQQQKPDTEPENGRPAERSSAQLPPRSAVAVKLERIAWAAATVCLLAVGTLRSAGWLFLLCLIGAAVAGTVAIGSARTAVGLILNMAMMPVAVFRGIGWLARTASSGDGAGNPAAPVPTPPPALPTSAERAEARIRSIRLGVAAGISVVLVMVFCGLFAWADPAFARIVSQLVPDLSITSIIRWLFLFVSACLGTVAAAFMLANPTTFGETTIGRPRPVRAIEWALPIGALFIPFGLFVAVQFAALFGGRDYVMRTAHLTFADYARHGFGQLLVVSLLILGVITLALRMAPRTAAGDRMLVRLMLGGLTACALVVVASATYRMWVYEQAYGFTRLRLVVSAFELWLGALFVLVLMALARLRGSWLPRAGLGAGLAVLLALAGLNPDGFIARENVDRFLNDGKQIDLVYLRGLSADAAVELDRLSGEYRKCVLVQISQDLADRDSWSEYNRARQVARGLDLPDHKYWPSDCYQLSHR